MDKKNRLIDDIILILDTSFIQAESKEGDKLVLMDKKGLRYLLEEKLPDIDSLQSKLDKAVEALEISNDCEFMGEHIVPCYERHKKFQKALIDIKALQGEEGE